jgi:hypothetical protein
MTMAKDQIDPALLPDTTTAMNLLNRMPTKSVGSDFI